MSKGKILSKIGEGFIKIGMKMRHYSPEILIVSGIVGGVVTVVMACKATGKTQPVLERAKQEVERVHKLQEKGQITVASDVNGQMVNVTNVYTERDARKELTKIYLHTGLDFAKIYLPAAGVGVLSAVSILAGGNILRKRNVALAAAYTTLDSSYKQYRERIAQKYGDEAEKMIRNGMTTEQITEKVTDENGKEKKVKKQICVAGNTLSDYASYYDRETSEHYEPSHEYNMMYLRGMQNTANDLLRTRRFLYLNDVREMIGLKKTLAGQSVGWIYDENLGVDNYIDFGIQEVYRHRTGDENDDELEKTIIVDFNVDGLVNENAIKLNLIEA